MIMIDNKEVDTCRHLIHAMHKRCKKGVDCKRFNWRDMPCFYSNTIQVCESREPFTPEEKKQVEAETIAINDMFTSLQARRSDICPHCKGKIKSMSQVGRCVYASPCQCRLWQGKLPDAWK